MTAQKTNEIFVKGDSIYVVCHGRQDKWAVQKTVSQFLTYAEEIKARGQSVSCIVDLSDDVGYDIGARDAAIKVMKTDAVPTAIVGINTAMGTVVNFMTKLAGQGDKYQIFKTTEEAEAWLQTL